MREVLLASLALTASCRGAPTPAAPLRVAAASDLTDAFTDLAARFESLTGTRVALTFGSSGMLSRQIAEGAPFDLFASADVSFVDRAVASGRCDAGSLSRYARGRLALVTRPGAPTPDAITALASPAFARVAIANPEHAPYGRAAREALQHVGAWDAVQDKLVLGENAAQAARFASSGSAQAGVLPLSLVRTDELASKGGFVTLPESWHAPLRQRMALVKGAGETARRFYAFLQSPEARAIFVKYGFVLPETARQ